MGSSRPGMLRHVESKWKYLMVASQWDKCEVPIYLASARRPVPLLKTLLSNHCLNECLYCPFRRGSGISRSMWDSRKLADIALRLWMEGKISGIFLSSSMYLDPDEVSLEEVEIAERLREGGFRGYIHLRLMPGTSYEVIKRSSRVADRIGINLEAPSPSSFSEICPDKGDYLDDLFHKLKLCIDIWKGSHPNELKAGVDTQVIVGATNDEDLEYLKVADRLIGLGIRRIYFSGFVPIPGTPLEGRARCSHLRVVRLYRAFFLIKDYGFTLSDMESIVTDSGMLPHMDPKLAYSRTNRDMFPIDLSQAHFRELCKVPCIGPRTALKIVRLRNEGKDRWTYSDLVSILGRKRARRASAYVLLDRNGLL